MSREFRRVSSEHSKTETVQGEQEVRELFETTQKLEKLVEERTGALRLMLDVTRHCNEAGSVSDTVSFTVRRVCKFNGWCFGHALFPTKSDPSKLRVADMCFDRNDARFDDFRRTSTDEPISIGQGLAGRVFESSAPEWITDVESDMKLREMDPMASFGAKAAIAFPINVDEHAIGVFEFFSDKTIEPDQDVFDAMATVGTQVAQLVERRRLEKLLINSEGNERQRLSRELHDQVSQQLAGLSMMLETHRQNLAEAESVEAEKAESLVNLMNVAQKHLRSVIDGLVPVEVTSDGLVAALREMMETPTGLQVDLRFDPSIAEVECSQDQVATHLFQIAKEAVHNALKHANAKRIELRVAKSDQGFVLSVIDDGVGFDTNTSSAGYGHGIMQYRARVIDAKLSIQSGPTGTRIDCQWSLD